MKNMVSSLKMVMILHLNSFAGDLQPKQLHKVIAESVMLLQIIRTSFVGLYLGGGGF